jgi:hypothetical protein
LRERGRVAGIAVAGDAVSFGYQEEFGTERRVYFNTFTIPQAEISAL